ncbi:MAG: WXG100 family type VII secretion target [Stackebrandtia sp.]
MSAAGIVEGGCHPDDPSGSRFPQPVEVEVDCKVWDLRAHPDLLTDAAKAWREHGDATSSEAEDLHRLCRNLLDAEYLTGDIADRFNGFESELMSKMDEFEGVSERVAEQLDDAASSLRAHQETLDGMRSAILAKVPGHETNRGDSPMDQRMPRIPTIPTVPEAPSSGSSRIVGCVAPLPTHIVFQASSFDDLRAIEDAKSEAKEVRAKVDEKNAEVHNNLDEIARDLGMMGRELLPDFGCSTPDHHNRELPQGRLPGGLTPA